MRLHVKQNRGGIEDFQVSIGEMDETEGPPGIRIPEKKEGIRRAIRYGEGAHS